MPKQEDGHKAIMRLVRDFEDDVRAKIYWLRITQLCLEEHERTGGEFAGAWVFNRAVEMELPGFNNLRPLSSRGIIENVGTTRGGKRAYYRIINPEGVAKALKEVLQENVSQKRKKKLTENVYLPFYANLASCSSQNMSEAYIDGYLAVDSKFVQQGGQYFVIRASGDSMNLAGIDDGDFLLIHSQGDASVGQAVLVCDEEGTTIKELEERNGEKKFVPRSENPTHKTIKPTRDTVVQGVVVTTLRKAHE